MILQTVFRFQYNMMLKNDGKDTAERANSSLVFWL